MLTQRLPDEDILKTILSITHQRTPTYLPKEWRAFLFINDENSSDVKRILTRLKRDVAKESLERLKIMVESLDSSNEQRMSILDILIKREKHNMGIEMVPLFVTCIAMIEVAKEQQIPICK